MFNPAQRLMPGTQLKDGWVVSEFIQPKEGDTGGNFSERYIVKKDGQEAFLKAMDYHRAFQPDVDTMKALNVLSSEYLFERELLEMCKDKKLSHVAHIIDFGSVYIGNESSHDTMVEYLIFELAEGDVRQSIEIGNEHQISAMIHALHNISLGLWQLHKQSAAHQDIKPSNALVFDDGKTKISDLGRASRKDVPTHLDKYDFAGSLAYAPPELCYRYMHPDWTARRLGTDLYMLGSMIAYFFSGVSMTALLQKEIPPEFIFGKAN